VKARFKAVVGIQTARGVVFGTTDWLKGPLLQLRAPCAPPPETSVIIKIELPDGESWLVAEARIVRCTALKGSRGVRVLTRIDHMGAKDRRRIRDFLGTTEIASPAPLSPPVPLHEPTIDLSRDGRSLTARWSDARRFRRDWALHISRGRLPVRGRPPQRRAFMMRLVMPDGFVTTFPAEIGESLAEGWLVRFLVPREAFARMICYAEHRSARVV